MKNVKKLEFENRFVAFLDILGFKEIISNKAEVIRIAEIVESETSTASRVKERHGIYPNKALSVTVISDSVVISIPYGDGFWTEKIKSLRYLLSTVEKIQFKCAMQNVWIRGGISYGEMHHSERNVVGNALVKAYMIEQNAIYPRIILDAKIMLAFQKGGGPSSRKALIKEMNQTFGAESYSGKFLFDKSDENWSGSFSTHFMDDTPLFVNYFHSVFSDLVTEKERKELAEFLKHRLYSAPTPHIYAKYKWVIEYLIATIPGGHLLDKGLAAELLNL